jgi:riboflavin biosynthesis pyrimidine reductase
VAREALVAADRQIANQARSRGVFESNRLNERLGDILAGGFPAFDVGPPMIASAVAALKQETGADLYVIGSTKLVETLIEHHLVDEFRLMIDPVVVGGRGKRIFRDAAALMPLRLVDYQVTAKGAILATYASAED